jgi:hypothetical protein
MKKEINDLLLNMQSGESCIGETANKLFDLKESSKQKKILSDEYIKKSAPAFFVSEPEASIMTNKWIEGAMWYRGKVATAMLREVKLIEEPKQKTLSDEQMDVISKYYQIQHEFNVVRIESDLI